MNKKQLFFGIGGAAFLVASAATISILVATVSKPATNTETMAHTNVMVEGIEARVYVNDLELNTLKSDIYIDEDGRIKLPLQVIRENLVVSVTAYGDGSFLLQKGSVKVKLDRDGNVTTDGKNMSGKFPILEKNGKTFIDSELLSEVFDYTFNMDFSKKTLKIDDPWGVTLPVSYNYSDIGKMTVVKNQGSLSTCWAFAAVTALETSVRPMEQLDFSVDNMANNNSYNSNLSAGGDYTRAISYLVSWKGPIAQSKDEYGDGIVNTEALPLKHVQEVQIIDEKNIESVKKAVFLYGGVESTLYSAININGDKSTYYNEINNSYCYTGTKQPNHDIVIVGWDDDYSKDNFNADVAGDGAFLCMNSWGSNFGDNGLFYVSYYDSNIATHSVVYTSVEDADNYDNIYQTDMCGWVGQMGYNDSKAYFANVYTANNDENLEAVGFYATGADTEYEVYVVTDFLDENSFANRKKVAQGQFGNSGYYTVNFDESVALTAGQEYAVVVMINTPDAVHPIAIEYVAGDATKNVDISDGYGFISYTGNKWEHVEDTKECNICLKAYTKNR